jgi:phosphatidylglycerol:prolipoprotein diacylglycerol transferase
MFNSNFPFYGLAILLALISNIIIVISQYKKYNYKLEYVIYLLLYENAGIIIGAKVLSYLLSGERTSFIITGLAAYGAAFGAALFILLFCLQFKKNIKETMYLLTPSFPLMYSIGKIGCFIVGCCYGIKYNGIFKIMYRYSVNAPNNVYLFPIQIVESIVFLLIFIYLIIMQRKNKFDEKMLGISFILCGASKGFLDFLRQEGTQLFTFSKIVSLIIIIIGIISLFLKKKSDNEKK